MTDTAPAKSLVPAISRARAILDLVAAEPDMLTLAELGRRTGLAKSSVHSLCATLTEEGLLFRNSDQSYAIGPHVMRWARAFSQRSDVATEFARLWDEGTVDLQGATITLSVLDETEVVYIGARNSGQLPWFNFRVGMRLPMAFTATGQALMARMSDSEIRHRLRDGLPPPMTARSPTTLDEVLALVGAARARGYSIDDQQVAEGMVCYGASVLNSANAPVAGVAVSLPAGERTAQKEAGIVAVIQRFATRISHRLGADLDAT